MKIQKCCKTRFTVLPHMFHIKLKENIVGRYVNNDNETIFN